MSVSSGTIALAVRSGFAPRPAGTSSAQIYGAALLCGIGFTMSLFIGALAFPGNEAAIDSAKIGTLAGSLLSGIVGFVVLRFASPVEYGADDAEEASEIFAADLREET